MYARLNDENVVWVLPLQEQTRDHFRDSADFLILTLFKRQIRYCIENIKLATELDTVVSSKKGRSVILDELLTTHSDLSGCACIYRSGPHLHSFMQTQPKFERLSYMVPHKRDEEFLPVSAFDYHVALPEIVNCSRQGEVSMYMETSRTGVRWRVEIDESISADFSGQQRRVVLNTARLSPSILLEQLQELELSEEIA